MKKYKARLIANTVEQQMRLEALKIACDVASHNDGIGNVLVHAQWVLEFLLTGKPPVVDEVKG